MPQVDWFDCDQRESLGFGLEVRDEATIDSLLSDRGHIPEDGPLVGCSSLQ